MLDTELIEKLNALDLYELFDVQFDVGRLEVPNDFRAFWTEQFMLSSQISKDARASSSLRKMARLLKEATFGVGTLGDGERPNYYQYTMSNVLDWYVSPETASLDSMRESALSGSYHLLLSLLEFESRSLGGFEARLQDSFDRERVHQRIERIHSTVDLVTRISKHLKFEVSASLNDSPKLENLAAYAHQESKLSALQHLSCSPLTRNHDEVVFIRVLQGSELCFLIIRACIISAIESLKEGQTAEAVEELALGTDFVRLLHELLRILRTMSVENFAKFRDQTGKASALQSVNYHLMEIFLMGVNSKKAMHFDRVDSLRPLLRYAHPEFVSLRRVLTQFPDHAGLTSAARELDKQLLTWRGLHLSFAKIYIPQSASGTGGTEGAAYLRKHLRASLYDDTEPDMDIIREFFPDDSGAPGFFRVPTRPGISPPEAMRTLVSRDPETTGA
jgi:tryptophan 2,3-dioxygenase